MKNVILPVLLFVIVLTACKKHDYPPPVEQPVSDARTILLKQILAPPLPSPYFEFEYDDSNFVTFIGFASRTYYWQVFYENKRVKKLVNLISKDSMVYNYTNGRVASIRHHSKFFQRVTWHYDFAYNNSGQLQQARWFLFEEGSKDSTLYRKALLKYQPDGNLAQFEDYRRDTTDQVTLQTTTTYKDYDQGTNVDDFFLLKTDFFQDLFFLPQVRFQKNNPRHVTGDNIDYHFETDYSYQYNAKNLPSIRTYNLIQTTKSSGTTQTFTGSTDYLY